MQILRYHKRDEWQTKKAMSVFALCAGLFLAFGLASQSAVACDKMDNMADHSCCQPQKVQTETPKSCPHHQTKPAGSQSDKNPEPCHCNLGCCCLATTAEVTLSDLASGTLRCLAFLKPADLICQIPDIPVCIPHPPKSTLL